MKGTSKPGANWPYRIGHLIGRALLFIAETERTTWDRHMLEALGVVAARRPETHDEWQTRMRAVAQADALAAAMERHPAGKKRTDSWSHGCER